MACAVTVTMNSTDTRPTNSISDSGLKVEALRFAYNGTPVLLDINLAVAEGEFVCLLGPSGCGKTTFLRLLAGLETLSSGNLSWKGRPITGPSLERSVVFQDYSLFPWMSLVNNITLALAKSHPETDKKWRLNLAEEFLEKVGLADAARKHPFELSGGMQQRGAIARTLALGSPVLLMDEPFGALDPVNRARLQDLVLDVWANANPREKRWSSSRTTSRNRSFWRIGLSCSARRRAGLFRNCACRLRVRVCGAPWPVRRNSRHCGNRSPGVFARTPCRESKPNQWSAATRRAFE
jgi:NitT/TauT family transport system ATP-binding protein